MPNRSKQKGCRYEAELVSRATNSGLSAKRAWGSNGAALGLHPEVDCVIAGYKVQAKRRKSLPQWMRPSDEVDVQAVREDHGETFIIMSEWDWHDLLKAAHKD